jgi:HD-GYP domain-containing protein (c-di-GMP phosphodiesterase class II)
VTNHRPFHTESADGHEFRDYCEALGLSLWTFVDGATAFIQSDAAPEPIEWLHAPALADRVSTRARHGLDEVAELFPGCWLLPIDDGLAGLAIGPEVVGTAEFDEVCASADLDPADAVRALDPVVRYRRRDLDALLSMLRALRGDLAAASAEQSTLKHLTGELADVYEQINVLYNLGLSMNRLDEPEDFLRAACELLQATIDFGWVSIAVAAPRGRGHVEPGQVVVAGAPPRPARRFERLVREAVAVLSDGAPTRLLEPADHGLALLTGDQVVVRAVVRDGRVLAGLVAGAPPTAEGATSVEIQLLEAVAEYLGSFLQNVGMFSEQRELFLGTLRALTATIDAKDRYTRGHSARVAYLAARLAGAAGCEEALVDTARIAGLVHDIGKIGVPESVLGKRGRLSDDEFDQMKQHPVLGYEILKDIPQLGPALPGVLHHHERWDGHGYPEGRRGENIPYVARVLAVADAFDAMSSDRTYRNALTRRQVLAEIEQCAGSQLDPELARLFLTLDLREYDQMIERHRLHFAQAA